MLDKEGLNSEVSVGVTYAAFMSAVSLFFTGIIVAQYKSFNPTIRVPVIFLIISTFSFIFSATIYSNAGAEITLNKLKVVEKYMIYAKNIVELLGLYLFVLATPLVIGAVTGDSFLRTATVLVAISGFTLYSQSKFSVLEKELTVTEKRALTATIVVLALCLYITQSFGHSSSLIFYNFTSILLLAVLGSSVVYFCKKSKQYKPFFFRIFKDDDAEALSEIILKNLDHIKSKAYSKNEVDTFRDKASPAAIRKLADDKQIFVAEFNNRVVGLACLNKNNISTVFTEPSLHRKGIGRMLVDHLENEISQQDYSFAELQASKVDHEFYKKMGYSDVADSETDGMVTMRREFRS